MKVDKPTTPKNKKEHDVVLVHRRSDDGKSYEVIRSRNGKVQAGSIAPLEHGKPITGDIVELLPRKESPSLYDVKVHHASEQWSESTGQAGEDTATLNRPARFATASYRKGWELTFAKPARKKSDSELN